VHGRPGTLPWEVEGLAKADHATGICGTRMEADHSEPFCLQRELLKHRADGNHPPPPQKKNIFFFKENWMKEGIPSTPPFISPWLPQNVSERSALLYQYSHTKYSPASQPDVISRTQPRRELQTAPTSESRNSCSIPFPFLPSASSLFPLLHPQQNLP